MSSKNADLTKSDKDEGGSPMRNKKKGFPNRISLSGGPQDKDEFASKRADGTIKDRPGERMFESNQVHNRQD